mmetsp:Transcript_70889/g.205502  ORF Transcript_70889/g.205502 Transcript_70889/m.205502 type:complete len:292 (-) Transcript_70889:563-1438(-)
MHELMPVAVVRVVPVHGLPPRLQVMAILLFHRPLPLLGRLGVRLRHEPLRRLPSVDEAKVLLDQVAAPFPVQRFRDGLELPGEAERGELLDELLVGDLPQPPPIQGGPERGARLRPELRLHLLAEEREQLPGLRAQLLEGRGAAVVIIQRLPQDPHIALPIHLPARFEQLRALHAHGAILVQGPAPSVVHRAELLPQKSAKVVLGVLARQGNGGLRDGLPLEALPRGLLRLPPPDLDLEPLEVAAAEVLLVFGVHGVEEQRLRAALPAASADACGEVLQRHGLHGGVQPRR